MKVIMATGGTGGHIYPALRLAEELKEQKPDADILFIGNSERIEAQIIPQQGYSFEGITAAAFNNTSFISKFARARVLYSAYKTCLKIIDNYQPDIVVGFGGYVTVPVVLAGHHRHIPTIIHEQNSYVGMANRLLGHYADAVVTCYDSANDRFPAAKVYPLGNPRASLHVDSAESTAYLQSLGLDTARPTVLVVMGSLGSASVNAKMIDAIRLFKDKPYNILYVTGPKGYDSFRQSVDPVGSNITVVPYIDQARAVRNCVMAISRGGATSACEYQSLGIPTIIIPSPYVPNNHQFHNAMAMVDRGAAKIIEEKDLQADSLVAAVDSLIDSPAEREAMKQAALAMSHPQAAADFAHLVVRLAGNRNEQ